MTEAHQLAEMLHDRMCHGDRSGACSWKYVPDPWTDPKYVADPEWPFRLYLNKAENLLKITGNSLEKAKEILKAIFGY